MISPVDDVLPTSGIVANGQTSERSTLNEPLGKAEVSLSKPLAGAAEGSSVLLSVA